LVPETDGAADGAAELATGVALLVDGQLVDPVAGEIERYRFHDLMRLLAQEKLAAAVEPGVVLAAKGRVVRWCNEQANVWGDMLRPVQRRQMAEALVAEQSADNSAMSLEEWEAGLMQWGLARFEAERETLVRMFDWAAATQQPDVSVALAANLAPFLSLRGYWEEWVSTHLQALAAARQAGDAQGEGQTLNNLGSVYRSQGKWKESIASYDQSLQIYRAIGDVHGEGQTLNNLGLVYRSQGRWNEAIAAYEQDLQICRAIGDVHGEGQTLNNLGVVYKSQGKWNEAITVYEQSLQIFRAIGDVHGEGQALGNLGVVSYFQGKWNEAIAAYEQSLQIFRAIGDVHGEGQALNNLGLVHQSQGKWNEAIAAYEQSLQICRAIGDVHGEGQTLANLGDVYKIQNNLTQAQTLWREALTKLHPDSPDHATVTQWLQAPTPRKSQWATWLLPAALLLFLLWNLVNGHWWIALFGVGCFALFWVWQRRR
jgi:tetratricopeptide (TPR) repeat protein